MDMAVREAAKLSRLLRMAAVAGVASAVKVHIDRGDDLNARDENGMTPLMLSASKNRVVVCELLIAAGADIRLLDPHGQDALAIALAAKAPEAASVLAAAGVEAPTPAELAREYSRADLLQAGAETKGETDLLPEARQVHDASLPKDSRRFVVALEAGEPIGLGEWEAEEEGPPPEDDPTLFYHSADLQLAISDHRPVDTSSDWDEFEAHLPEQASPLARPGDSETRERLRRMLLRAMREGSVPHSAIQDLSLDDDRSPNEEASRALRMVVNDLGAEADERFEYVAEHESFEVFVAPETTAEEEDTVTQALGLIDNLASRRNDPLRLYQKEFQRHTLISGDQELALSQAMERAVDAALLALSAWPGGLTRVLASSKMVMSGSRPLRWMSDSARADMDESEEQVGAARSSDSISATLDAGDEEQESPAPAAEGEPSGELAEYGAKLEALARMLSSTDESARHEALVALSLTRNYLIGLADACNDAGDQSAAFARGIADYLVARDKMAIANLKLVSSIALKYRYSGELLAPTEN